jgi:hypothetical protein
MAKRRAVQHIPKRRLLSDMLMPQEVIQRAYMRGMDASRAALESEGPKFSKYLFMLGELRNIVSRIDELAQSYRVIDKDAFKNRLEILKSEMAKYASRYESASMPINDIPDIRNEVDMWRNTVSILTDDINHVLSGQDKGERLQKRYASLPANAAYSPAAVITRERGRDPERMYVGHRAAELMLREPELYGVKGGMQRAGHTIIAELSTICKQQAQQLRPSVQVNYAPTTEEKALAWLSEFCGDDAHLGKKVSEAKTQYIQDHPELA